MQYVAIWITRSGHFEGNVLQVRKSFFAELGIYENETFIRQVYTDFILGKANHSNENFEVSYTLHISSLIVIRCLELTIPTTVYNLLSPLMECHSQVSARKRAVHEQIMKEYLAK